MTTDTLAPAAPTTKEPSTKFGQFYRAHRPEVLAGGGAIVAAFAYWRSKHGSSSSSASTQIDPATGEPVGSAADEAALAAANGAGTSTPYSVTPGGGDGSTGYSGGGYGGGGGDGSDISSELQTLNQTLTGDQTLLQGIETNTTPSSLPPNPTPVSPVVARTNAQNVSLTEANLKKDQAAAKANPSAKNKAAVKNLTTRLGKEKG